MTPVQTRWRPKRLRTEDTRTWSPQQDLSARYRCCCWSDKDMAVSFEGYLLHFGNAEPPHAQKKKKRDCPNTNYKHKCRTRSIDISRNSPPARRCSRAHVSVCSIFAKKPSKAKMARNRPVLGARRQHRQKGACANAAGRHVRGHVYVRFRPIGLRTATPPPERRLPREPKTCCPFLFLISRL